MKKKQKKTLSKARLISLAAAFCLLGIGVLLIALYVTFKHLPLLLIAITLQTPAVINLILLLPAVSEREKTAQPEHEAEPEEEPERLPLRQRIKRALAGLWCRMCNACRDYYCEKRHRVLTTLILVVIGGAVLLFWYYRKRPAAGYVSGFLLPVIMAVLFVLSIVFDKWCKHAAEDGDDVVPFDLALLRNLRSAFCLGEVILVLEAVVLTVHALGFINLQSYLPLVITILFIYELLSLVVALVARLVRNELLTAPDLAIPMPGLGGGDFGILVYLEKNTGISMRSLWSMQLIRLVFPYALMLSLLLIWASTGLVQIEASQQGALYRFGKLQPEVLEPGLHMTLPWPFDQVEVVDTETVQKVTVGYIPEREGDNIWTESHGSEEYKLLLGGGNELISINLRVEYCIDDLHAYLTNCSAPVQLLEAAAYEMVLDNTISTDLDTMLSTDRVAFAESMKAVLTERMETYHTGLRIVSVVLESIHPPVEVATVYQDFLSAGVIASTTILDAEARAAYMLASAYAKYESDVNGQRAESYMAIANANEAVASFMASVEADETWPGEYRYYKYLEALKSAYADARLVIVGDGVNSSNIYIGNLTDSTVEK
ncbi:MAG: protease modulator HflK [Clostridia bacterium]|nr:protease modulator HflK [Clostridia bacterium]